MSGTTHPSPHPARARLRRAAAALVAVGAVAAVAGPASADAATAHFENHFVKGQFVGERLIYEASPGENNSLVITEINDRGLMRLDDTVAITAAGCERPIAGDSTVVECRIDFEELVVRLNDGTNVLRSFSGSVPMSADGDGASSNSFDGGAGKDSLFGSQGRDILLGGSGNDALHGFGGNDSLGGGPGNESLFGGEGDDQLNGNAGIDTLQGGAGIDTATYRDRSAGVKVTIEDAPNDGEPGEGDNVRPDVEHVEGGAGNDEIIDLFGAGNAFFGRGGSDKLVGGPGEDQTLVGGPGDDSIDGGAGNDMLFGSDGFDLLKGGTENDLLFGEAGSLDTLDGGPAPTSSPAATGSTSSATSPPASA